MTGTLANYGLAFEEMTLELPDDLAKRSPSKRASGASHR
jgi:hypothetical protein